MLPNSQIGQQVGRPLVTKSAAVSATLLIVDSDSLIRRLTRDTLEPRGYVLREARSSEEALAELEAMVPDLVLLDASMARQPDERLLLRLTEARHTLILMTGATPDDQPAESLLQLSAGRLEKPFSPSELQELIEEQLGSLTQPDGTEKDALLAYARQLDRVLQENRRKAADLRSAHRRLQEVERMKDIFLSLVSHELRTPLTIIKGNLHLLTRLLRESEGVVSECLASASFGAGKLESLIEELLSFSSVRNESGNLDRTSWDFFPWIKTLAGEFEPLARSRQVTLESSFEGEEHTLEGDPQKLRQAFSHLLKNAILFNRTGGMVQLKVKRAATHLQIAVIDNGPGIPHGEQEKVFQPFYQAQEVNTRKIEGLGLGLSIARHVIEAHAGTLKLESDPGQGTRVDIELPLSAPNPGTGLAEPALETDPKLLDKSQLLDYARDLYQLYDTEKARRKHAEEQQRELETTFIRTLAALVRMVDPRPAPETSQTDRILRYAKAVAERIDPSLPKQRDFLYSLLLYDIGKIGVAEAVLHKAGHLSEQERRSVEAHTEIGADLLSSIGYLGTAIEGVRSHHERWDGSGYPDGLKGHEIPLYARIIAVVDAFDAMTVDRPYRSALSHEKACEELTKGAGSHFDPQVVEAFLAAFPELV